MNKHTPGPWIVRAPQAGNIEEMLDCGISADVNGEHKIIAETFGQVSAHNFVPAQANAAHIVKCVNMHEELIAFVRAQECHCEDSSDYGPQACARCVLLAKVERP